MPYDMESSACTLLLTAEPVICDGTFQICP